MTYYLAVCLSISSRVLTPDVRDYYSTGAHPSNLHTYTQPSPSSTYHINNTSHHAENIEYCCQHFRFIVQRWCKHYERTNKPCPANITHLEIRNEELCCMSPVVFPRLMSPHIVVSAGGPAKQNSYPAGPGRWADCRPREPPAWEHMIRRSNRPTPYV
ncbi:hypothetical protein F4778DRAFT_478838 [Xylariomycetidae sp. FL2044]|nr:hypothetical protein F4778DRAFT_478838 [Xylariomycetidae sp. FL2044]